MLTWWGIVQSLFCIGLFSCSMNWFVYVFSVPWEEDVKIVIFGKTTSWVTLHVSLGIWVVSPQVYFFGHLGKVVTITFTFVNAHFCFMLLLKICCCSSCLSRRKESDKEEGLPSVGTFPKCLQWQAQSQGWSQELQILISHTDCRNASEQVQNTLLMLYNTYDRFCWLCTSSLWYIFLSPYFQFFKNMKNICSKPWTGFDRVPCFKDLYLYSRYFVMITAMKITFCCNMWGHKITLVLFPGSHNISIIISQEIFFEILFWDISFWFLFFSNYICVQ